MKMRTISLILFSLGVGALSTSANAWFFFFIPGSVISKVGDALTGAEGENCVSTSTQVGQLLTSAAGNTATVKSLSGESTRCQNPAYPIRALLQFNYSFSSQVGIDLPDDFKPKELTSMQRFNGTLLHAIDQPRSIGVYISAQPKKAGTTGAVLAQNVSANIVKAIDDAVVSNPEEIPVNGLHAYRFRVVGKNKGIFGQSYTYIVTVLEGPKEYVVLNANCLTSDFEKNKEELERYAFNVKGLEQPQTSESTAQTTSSPTINHPIDPSLISVSGTHIATPVTLPASPTTPQATDNAEPKKTGPTPPTTEPPPIAGGGAGGSIEDRLRALDKLLKEGLITSADYEAKKKELLKQL